jgi:hypothetical protein
MPRLSVDLDLVFPDHTLPREQALGRINEAIRQSVARLKKQGFQTHAPAAADSGETKLLVRRGRIEVKIEVNFVMRGTVHPVRMASLTQNARETLQADLEIPVVSLEDVYGGKLVAANLDELAWAAREQRILLTFDHDFGELARGSAAPRRCGVVLPCTPMPRPVDVGLWLADLITARDDWAGCFSVIEPGRVRMRTLGS